LALSCEKERVWPSFLQGWPRSLSSIAKEQQAGEGDELIESETLFF
jgi:hypothetical protein